MFFCCFRVTYVPKSVGNYTVEMKNAKTGEKSSHNVNVYDPSKVQVSYTGQPTLGEFRPDNPRNFRASFMTYIEFRRSADLDHQRL